MSKKTLVKEIKPYIELHMDRNTGIAWVENGSTGNGHSAHPSIDATGSVKGMKNLGYWKNDDITVKSHGSIYNVSKIVVTDEYDQIAKENCRCIGCRG
jgi:hypothetical protein